MQPAPRRERQGGYRGSNNNNCLVIKVQQGLMEAPQRRWAKRGPQSWVKREEVSSGSAVAAGGPLAEAEARAPILSKRGGSIEPERRFGGEAGSRRRARAPGLSKRGGSIEPERCCCWGAGFGATPKRLSVSLDFRGNAAGASARTPGRI